VARSADQVNENPPFVRRRAQRERSNFSGRPSFFNRDRFGKGFFNRDRFGKG
jgi:hypothetical protein